jgi:hypothetical protein
MKASFVAVLLSLLAAGSAWAQATERVNFQGKLTSSTGTPVNGNVAMSFRIYTGSAGGAPVWTETQAVVPVVNGIYTVYLGDINTLASLNFASAYWLSVEVGSDGEMTPRYRLSSSPYAVRARVANQLEGLTATATQLNQLVGGGNADTLHVHDWAAITGKPSLAQLSSANSFTATQTINTGDASLPGLVIKGALGQGIPLQEWRDDANLLVAAVNPSGTVTGMGFTTPGNVSAQGALLTNLLASGLVTLNAANVQMQNASVNLTGATMTGGSFSGGTFTNGTFSGNGAGLTNLPSPPLADGSVTGPKIASLPKVRAANPGSQTANAFAKVVLSFPTETYDTDNMHDNVTNPTRLTVKTAGVYRIAATVPISGPQNGGWRMIEFRKNGGTIIGGIVYAGSPQADFGLGDMVSATVTDSFAVGDYVEVIFSQNNQFNNLVDAFRPSATMDYVP